MKKIELKKLDFKKLNLVELNDNYLSNVYGGSNNEMLLGGTDENAISGNQAVAYQPKATNSLVPTRVSWTVSVAP